MIRAMFSNLSQRLSNTLAQLRGVGRLTDANIQEALAEVRHALIDADVALSVVKQFIDDIQTKAIGQAVVKSIRPGDVLIKLVQDELTQILGTENAELNLRATPPVVILMAGLQGSGKTTSTAKLARLLKQQNKKTLLVSTDVYRPAAIEQLHTLATQIEVDAFPSQSNQKPLDIATAALSHAKKQFYDVMIIDTAGRLHIDQTLMQEIQAISQATSPTETLLVVDSMAGQDAAQMAKTFNEQLTLTGIVLTKTDGDARGGAALSMRVITGKPIKFLGVGEKIDALEPFHPKRIASRILGMGDIVSLVEQAQQKVDKKEADKIAQKLKKGKRFDFNDFLSQLQQMKNMGGLQSILGKLPGLNQMPKKAAGLLDDKLLIQMQAIVQSMTQKERRFPALLNGSRKVRIAKGSGTQVQDVNKLLKQFAQMQKMLLRFKGDKMQKQMQQLQSRFPGGKLPEGFEGLSEDLFK